MKINLIICIFVYTELLYFRMICVRVLRREAAVGLPATRMYMRTLLVYVFFKLVLCYVYSCYCIPLQFWKLKKTDAATRPSMFDEIVILLACVAAVAELLHCETSTYLSGKFPHCLCIMPIILRALINAYFA
jgi:hypothetical protein